MFARFSESIALARERSQEACGTAFATQLGEMLLLLFLRGLGPGNYHKYQLWRKDMPWEQKLGYWHDQRYYRFLDQVNPLAYRMIARHKIVAKALLDNFDLPTPRTVAYVDSRRVTDPAGRALPVIAGLEELLNAPGAPARICFKPVEGSHGEGFCAAELVKDEQLHLRPLNTHRALPLETFVERELTLAAGAEYLVEQYIDQHPQLAAFNTSSLNTLRVWAANDRSSNPRVLGVFLRVGRAGSVVDSRMDGGIRVRVDRDSFLTQVGISQGSGAPTFARHPDSGFELGGKQLPFRQETIALALKTTRLIPAASFVGLDIGFASDGPVVVEFNLAPTPIGAVTLGESHSQLLGWLLEEA